MHHLADARAASGLGEPDRADDVDRRVELRIVDRAADVDLGGQVEDHLGLGVGEQPDQVGVDDVGLGEVEVGGALRLAEVLAAPRTEVVDAEDASGRPPAGGLPASIR